MARIDRTPGDQMMSHYSLGAQEGKDSELVGKSVSPGYDIG